MRFLYALFRQDPESREGVILTTSGLGIIVNILTSAMKIVIGLAVSSIAVVSEGLNNAADAASGILTILGTKLAAMHPTEKHPFGYGRIEYLTSLVIGGLILYAGLEAFTGAVDGILHPYEVELSFLITGLIGFSVVNNDRKAMKEMRGYIARFVREQEHVRSYHALYIDPKNNDIYCDLVVDYGLRDWEALEAEFREYMRKRYPESRMEIVIETEYV